MSVTVQSRILWHEAWESKETRETAIARQRLCKHETIPEPSLSNVRTQQLKNCWKRCFLCGPRRGYIRSQFLFVSSVMTDPSSRQRGRPTSTKPQLSDSNKNLVLRPTWRLTPWLTWSTDRRLYRDFDLMWVQFSMGAGSWGKYQLKPEVGVWRWSEMVASLQGREPRSRGTSAVESHCQDRDWEHKSVCNSDLQSVVTSSVSVQ
jgi:hypothetical protein